MDPDDSAPSLSSGDEEMQNFAKLTPQEESLKQEKLLLKRLPKAEQIRIRSEAMRSGVTRCLEKKKAIEEKLDALRVSVNSQNCEDPLAEIPSISTLTPNALFAKTEIQSPLHHIKSPFNKVVFDFATSIYPFFRGNHNLLTQGQNTHTQRVRGELLIYIHEEVGKDRFIYGVGVKGPIGKVREVRMFKLTM